MDSELRLIWKDWRFHACFRGDPGIWLPPVSFSLTRQVASPRLAAGFRVGRIAGYGMGASRGPIDDCLCGPDHIVVYLRFWRFWLNLMWRVP